MTKRSLIENLMIHFNIRELVCPHVYEMHGFGSWLYLDVKLLWSLLALRVDILNLPLVINNYNINGSFTQRGLRCPFCPLVQEKLKDHTLYLSPHLFGMAVDCDIKGLSAGQARQIIIKNQKVLLYPGRIESNVNWLHFDVFDNSLGNKLTFF
jgi:hypothetical protein